MGKRLVVAPSKADDSRHLRWESFEERIFKGPPSVEAISGTPRVHLFIEPAGRRIGIRFFTRSGSVVLSPLAEVAIREVGVGSETALEVTTDNKLLYRDFYSLCCSIADRAQIEKQPVPAAVATTLASWAALIRRKNLLSQERQIGLLGELLFLRRTAKSLSWNVAAHAWMGPDSEEHDFVLPSIDAEVKTTSREQRIHTIGSLTQLQPKFKRKLHLVSVQLTFGGENKDSFSLSTMVATILAAAGKVDSAAAELIREQIRRQGWEDEDASHYVTRYCLRAPFMAIPVSGDFPAITSDSLLSLGRKEVSRIASLTYSINVDNLGEMDGTRKFERLLFAS